MPASRTSNAVRNTVFSIIGKFIGLVASFGARTVFIWILGNEYLGISSLYSEILSLLSVAELGFGTALNFALYEPIAKNDNEKIKMILQYYRKVYFIISIVIATLGIVLIPFLRYIVKGADSVSEIELVVYYVIYLINTVVSYFVTYKYSYVNAIQNSYVTTTIDTIVNIIIQIIQIIVLLITNNFLFYLISNSVIMVCSRFLISQILDRKFAILSERPERLLNDEEKAPILKDVKGAFIYQISSVAVHSTDSIIISTLSGLGVVTVGYISNYNIVINSVVGFTTLLFSNTASGYGNLVAESTTENYRKVFFTSDFMAFWVYAFCGIAFYLLLPPFIILWIGEEYLIDSFSFMLIILNLYIQGQSTAFTYARGAKGEYIKDRRIGVYQAVANLVISIIGVKIMGLPGVFLGTVVSRLIFVLGRPYMIYEFCFKRPVKEYYHRWFFFLGTFVFVGVVSSIFTNLLFSQISMLSVIGRGLFVFVFVNGIFYKMFRNRPEFVDIKKRVSLWMKKK